MKKKIYVYDLETYPTFFLFSFRDIQTGEVIHFEISDRKNEFVELKAFLESGQIKYLIGFNNLFFDYPVIHKCILEQRTAMDPQDMYWIVQNEIISQKYSSIKPWEVKVPQIDLYKIWHYDNKNKATSLKWLEFALRMSNIEDLPYPVGSMLDDDQKDNVIQYCENDLEATNQFLDKSIKHISLRKAYSNMENLDLMNSSEIRMTKQIMLKYLSKVSGIAKRELAKMRSVRREVDLNEIVFDYIKFNDPENQKVLNEFKSRTWRYDVDTEKALNSIAFTTRYKNVVREYAEGGLHSFGEPGIYESDDDYVLVDVDFASYYPHLTFMNNLHPEHIDEEVFNKTYQGFYEERKKYPKKDPRNYVLKIVLNGTYGLSKDKYSFLYDPKWQLAVTVNGQLLLTLLTEMIFEYCMETPQIIFENTDGAMYRIKRTDLKNLKDACDDVEAICHIPLETQECKKIIARDVNNYINIISDDNIKFKGAFEIDRDYHKNHSKRIVPLALANYYIHGVPVEQSITEHLSGTKYDIPNDKGTGNYENHGVYDFCLGAKMKGGNKLYSRTQKADIPSFTEAEKIQIVKANGWYEYYGDTWLREGASDRAATDLDHAFRTSLKSEDFFRDEPLGKVTRYYVSNEGVELIKKLPPLAKNKLTATDKHKLKHGDNQMNIFDIVEDVRVDAQDRESNLEVGYKCTVMNEFKDKPDYDINYDYYINECNKIIEKCGTNSMVTL